MLNATRAICRRSQSLSSASRTFGARQFSDGGPDVELDHGKGEWKTFGVVKNYNPGKFTIQTFNKISPIGLKQFPDAKYEITDEGEGFNTHAILLRSHKLQESEIKQTVRAIAR